MIVIVSNSRERAAFSTLCEAQGLPAAECDSVANFVRLIRRTPPKVVLTRHKIADGFSDDIIAALDAADLSGNAKIVVLMGAGASAAAEARQIAMGADCVQRDPIRIDVLLAYLIKYSTRASGSHLVAEAPRVPTFTFAGALVMPVERKIRHGDRETTLTPREVQLLEVLAQAKDTIVSYDTLYSEILQRRFAGDTSNMRVLLGKLASSARKLGIPLRRWVEVISKTGYRYRAKGIRP